MTTIIGPNRIQTAGSPATRFSGVGDAIANTVQAIDKSELTKLFVSDVGGMVIPRTGIEAYERGVDMGRETAIREVTGTITNVFLVGWFMAGLVALFNKIPALKRNSVGAASGAWVQAKSLEAFQTTFAEVLAKAQTPTEARQLFVETLLRRIQSSNVSGAANVASAVAEKLGDKALAEGFLAEAAKTLGHGKLSDEGVAWLMDKYVQSAEAGKGVYNVQAAAYQRLKESGAEAGESALRKMTGKAMAESLKADAQKAFESVEKRTGLAAKIFGETKKIGWIEHLTEKAVEMGLTDEVHLLGAQAEKQGEKPLLANQPLSRLLREIKYFMEHYADSVLSDASGILKKESLTPALREEVGSTLSSLIQKTFKAKRSLLIGAMGLTLLVGMAIAPLNNWWTQRKHGGRVFFPGEETGQQPSPPQQTAFRQSSQAFNSAPQAAALHPLTRPNGPFARFQQHRMQQLQEGGSL